MAYRDSTTNGGSSATPSVAVPAGVVAGDIVILACGIDATAAVFDTADWPSGFTEIGEAQVTYDGHKAAIGWKRLTGADAGSYTFGNLGASGDWVCQAIAFSGRHATNPPVASTANIVSTGLGGTSGTVTATGVTAVAGDDLLWVSVPDVNASGAGNGHTPPANYTEAEDAENLWSNLSLAYRLNVAAGATGNVSGTFAYTTNAGYVAWLVRGPASAGAEEYSVTGAVALAAAASGAAVKDGAASGSVPVALAGSGAAVKVVGASGELSLAVAASDGDSKAGVAVGAVSAVLDVSASAVKMADTIAAVAVALADSGATGLDDVRSTSGGVSVGLGASGATAKAGDTTGALSVATLLGAVAAKDGQAAAALAVALATVGNPVKTADLVASLGLSLDAVGAAVRVGGGENVTVGQVTLALALVATAAKVADTAGAVASVLGVSGAAGKVVSTSGVVGLSVGVAGVAYELANIAVPRRAVAGRLGRAYGGAMIRANGGRVPRAAGGRIG